MKTKILAMVMVLGMVSNKGDVMPPHIFETDLRVNTEVYLDIMANVVKPWMDEVAAGILRLAVVWCTSTQLKEDTGLVQGEPAFFWEKEIWPPSSPDCNLWHFFVWGMT
jgi:hypothetical protein